MNKIQSLRESLINLNILDIVINNLKGNENDEIKMALSPFYISNKIIEMTGAEVGHSYKSSLKMMNTLLEMVNKEPWTSKKFNGLIHQAYLKGYIRKPNPELN